MTLLLEIKVLLQKDLRLALRSGQSMGSTLLYLVSTIFICSQAFKQLDSPITWNALFWIILLFAAIQGLSKGFEQHSAGQQLYLYLLASSEAIILAKLIYNALCMALLTLLAFAFYSLVFANPVQDHWLYLLSLFLGACSFSSAFTLLSAIASKASSPATLMAILGFPIILPVLVALVKLAKNAMDGLDRSASYDEIGLLILINLILIILSVLLFPYIWAD